jgi:hypothetical protein
MAVYIAPKKWPALDDNPSSAEVALNLRRVFNTLNDHDQAINTMYANGTTVTTETVTKLITEAATSSSSSLNVVTSFNGSKGDITFFNYLGTVDNQVGVTSYTTQSSDDGAMILIDDSSAVAITLNFNVSAPWFTTIVNLGTGTATLTPSSGTVNGAASVTLYGGSFSIVYFDSTNFWASLLPIASTSQFGLVKPDNSTITISNGVISSVSSSWLGGTLSISNITIGSGAGTGATYSIVGTDGNHTVAIETGTSPAASSMLFTITFTASRGHTTYPVIWQAGLSGYTSLAQSVWINSSSSTSYTINSGSTALTAGVEYYWNVVCP